MTIKLTNEELKIAFDNAFDKPVYLDHAPTLDDILLLSLSAVTVEAQRKLFRELENCGIFSYWSPKQEGFLVSIKKELGL